MGRFAVKSIRVEKLWLAAAFSFVLAGCSSTIYQPDPSKFAHISVTKAKSELKRMWPDKTWIGTLFWGKANPSDLIKDVRFEDAEELMIDLNNNRQDYG